MRHVSHRTSAAYPGQVPQAGAWAPPPSPVQVQDDSLNRSVFDVPRNIIFTGLCIYTFVIVSYKLGIAAPAMWVAIIALGLKPKKIQNSTAVKIYVAYLAWSLVGTLGGPYPEEAFPNMTGQLKLVMVFIVAVSVLRSFAHIRFYLLLFVGAFVTIPARASIVNYVTGYRGMDGRAVGPFIYENSNDLAAFCLMAMGLALAAVALCPKHKLIRIGLVASAGMLAVLILMTQSRGVFLGMAVMMTPFFFHSVWGNPKRLVLMVLLGVVVIAVAPRGVWERVGGLRNLVSAGGAAAADAEGSASERLFILRTGIRILNDHWVVGAGKGIAPLANGVYGGWGQPKDVHNSYLALIIEGGFLGLGLFLWLIGGILWRARLTIHRARSPSLRHQVDALRWLLATGMGFLICATFGSYFHLPQSMLLFAVIWAATDALQNKMDEEKAARAMAAYSAAPTMA